MLHQYTSQQYSNLNSHYSPLDNCSHLLERTFLEPTKLSDLVEDCVVEQNGFYMEEKYHSEMENECQAYDTPKDVQGEDEEAKSLASTNICDLLEQQQQQQQQQPVLDTKDCDTETSQLINDEQNNNNVEKSPIKSESYDYQKYETSKEESELLPFISLDVDTIINAPVATAATSPQNDDNGHAVVNIDGGGGAGGCGSGAGGRTGNNDSNDESDLLQRKIEQLTADEMSALCDDTESGFRLPGFHQAFGSTEIGRFVHPKDFIEQITSPPTIAVSAHLSLPLPLPQPPSSLPLALNAAGVGKLQPPPTSSSAIGAMMSSPMLNGMVGGRQLTTPPNGAKIKSRYQKRAKSSMPPPTPATLPPPVSSTSPSTDGICGSGGGGGAGSRSACWSFESSPVPDSSTSLPNNGCCYKRKDMRRTKSGQMASDGNAAYSGYYNGVGGCGGAAAGCGDAVGGADDYYGSGGCSSSYYGGCTDYANCEYYRYQQQQQQQHQQSSQYHNHHHSNYHLPSSPSPASPSPSSYSCSSYSNGVHAASGGGGGSSSSSSSSFNGYGEEHCQRLQPYIAAASSTSASPYGHHHHSQQGWRGGGERFFPYGEQFPYNRYKQNGGHSSVSSSYMYQNYAGSLNQYMPSAQQSYQNYGYNSHPPVPNYNYF